MSPAPTPDHVTPDEASQLVASCEALCWHIARKWQRRAGRSVDPEDIAAAARVGLWRSALRWNPAVAAGKPFIAYAGRSAWREAAKFLARERTRGVRVPRGEHLPDRGPLVTSLADWSGTRTSAGDAVAARFDPPARLTRLDPHPDLEAVWANVAALLGPQYARALELHYRHGLRLREVAAVMGVTASYAGELVRRAVKTLRNTTKCHGLYCTELAPEIR